MDKDIKKKLQALNDDDMEKVAGGRIHAIQAVLYTMLAAELKEGGYTKEQTIEELTKDVEKGSQDYFDILLVIDTVWSQQP